jgi:hypothetical protein
VPFDEFLAGELHLLDGIRPEQLGDERIWQRVLEFNQDPAAWEPPAVPIEVVEISGPHGGIPVRLYGRREAATALLWLHGGGFLAGDLDMPAAHVVATELAARRTPSSPRSCSTTRTPPGGGCATSASRRCGSGSQEHGQLRSPVHRISGRGGLCTAPTDSRLPSSGAVGGSRWDRTGWLVGPVDAERFSWGSGGLGPLSRHDEAPRSALLSGHGGLRDSWTILGRIRTAYLQLRAQS